MVHPNSGDPPMIPRQKEKGVVFHKEFVTVGQPETTKTNINDDYVRDPPHNVDHNAVKQHNLKQGHKKPIEPDAPDDAELGREKKEVTLAEIAHDDAVHD